MGVSFVRTPPVRRPNHNPRIASLQVRWLLAGLLAAGGLLLSPLSAVAQTTLPTAIFDRDSVTVTEAPGAGRTTAYTVRLDAQPAENVEIELVVAETRDRDPIAATVSPESWTFTPGNWSIPQTFTVTARDDTHYNPDPNLDPERPSERYRRTLIRHVVVGGVHDGQGVGDVQVAVKDDEGEAVVYLNALAKRLRIEEDGTGENKGIARLNVVTPVAVSVDVEVTVLPAPNGEYEIVRGGKDTPVILRAGSLFIFHAIELNIVNNNRDEPDQMVAVEYVTDPVLSDPGIRPILTIIDDDEAPTVDLMVVEESVEEGASVRVKATMSHPSSEPTTVTVMPVAGFYTVGTPATLTIPANEIASEGQGVEITAVDDTIDNLDPRQLAVTGTAANDHGIAESVGTDSLNLIDNDDTPSATLVLTPETIGESGEASVSRVTAMLSHGSSKEVTLTVSAVPGAETEASDYSLTGTTLTFAPEATRSTGEVTIAAVDDNRAEPDKSVTVSAGVAGGTATTPQDETLTITEDDEVEISLAGGSAIEGESIPFTIHLSSESSVELELEWGLLPPPANPVPGRATEADIFGDEVFGGVTIQAGDTTATFSVRTKDDELAEGDEILEVGLRFAQEPMVFEPPEFLNARILNDQDNPVESIITDNDRKGISIAPLSLVVTEDATSRTAEYSVVLSQRPEGNVKITPMNRNSDVATVSPELLTFTQSNWNTARKFTVTGRDDSIDNPGRTATIRHIVEGGGYEDVEAEDVEVTLVDDDTAGVTVSKGMVTVGENSGVDTYTVALRSDPDGPVTVTPTSQDPSVAAVSPPSLTFTKDNWMTGQSVTVTGEDNAVYNISERGTVITHSVSGYGSITTARQVAVAVTDDESVPVATLALGSPSISEDGGSTEIRVTLEPASEEQVEVTISAEAVSPATGDDFQVTGNRTLTIRPGESSSTGALTITARNNEVDAPDKSVTVSAMVTAGTATDPSQESLTIADDEGTPTVTLLLGTDPTVDPTPSTSVPEQNRVVRVTATISPVSSEPTTVTVDVVEGAYQILLLEFNPGRDQMTIPAGASTSTGIVPLHTVHDYIDTPTDRRVSVTATATNGHGVVSAAVPAELILRDFDRAGTEVSKTAVTMLEAGGTDTYTIVLKSRPTGTVTVTPSPIDPTIATFSPATLTFAADKPPGPANNWNHPQTVTVMGINDNADNPLHRSAVISHSVTGYDTVTTAQPVTVTVTDDDMTPSVTLALAPESISENGDSTTVTATVDQASDTDITLTIAAEPVAPATRGDFTLSGNKTLTIPAGQTESSGTVTVTAEDNKVDAPDKTVTISATVTAGSANPPASQPLTITDDEGTPTATLVLAPERIDESGASSTSTVTATLDHGSSEEVRLMVTAAAGAQTVAGDFTLTGTMLTIAPEATASMGTVTISAQDNEVAGPTKTVTVTATVGGSSGIQNPAAKTLTITDDDSASISVGDASATEGGTVTFTVSLSSRASADVSVDWGTLDDTAGSGDYTGGAERVTIPTGMRSATIEIQTTEDSMVEENETFFVTLTQPFDARFPDGVTLDDATAIGTIIDNDTANISIIPVALTVTEADEGENSKTYEVVLTSAPTGTVTITPMNKSSAAMVKPESLTFTAMNWNDPQTVTVTGVDDKVDNPTDRKVTITHDVAGDGYGEVVAADVTVTVTDDDTAGVTIKPTAVRVAEDGGTNSYTVVLDSEPTGTVTVNLTGIEEAVAGISTPTSMPKLTFTDMDWDNPQTVTVTGAADDQHNPVARTMTIVHEVTGYGDITEAPSVTVTATDNESMPTATLELGSSSIGETGGMTAVTARLDEKSEHDVTLTVSVEPVAPATEDDFTLSANLTLTIPAGQTESTDAVTVTAEGNNVDAPDKTFTISARVATGTATAPGDQSLTITDDDGPPTVTLLVSNPTMPENNGTVQVTARLDHPSSAPTTITVEPRPEYTVTAPGRLTIPAGATGSIGSGVTITAVDNPVDNVTHLRARVAASVVNTHGVSASVVRPWVTLVDDEETPTVTLLLEPPVIGEEGVPIPPRNRAGAQIRAVFSHASSEDTVLRVVATAGAETVPSDFTLEVDNDLPIPKGSTRSHSVWISANDNDVVASGKSVVVSATVDSPNLSEVDPPQPVTLTITEDDTATISVADARAAEGNAITFTVSMSAEAAADVAVDWVAAGGTATSGADYTDNSGRAMIVKGNTSATFTVQTAEDDEAEGEESFTVTLSEPDAPDDFPPGISLAVDPVATGTINDGDAAGVTIMPTTLTVTEASGNDHTGQYTVVLDSKPSQDVTITLMNDASTAAMVSEAKLMFTAMNWETPQPVTVTAVDDSLDNPSDRMATIRHVVEGYGDLTEGPTVEVTVTDDEDTPTATLILSPETINEGVSPVSSIVTARLSHGSSEAVTLTISADPDSADTKAGDFGLSQTTELTFAPGDTESDGTVTVFAEDNDLVEIGATKSVRVTAAVGGDSGISPPDPKTLTIAEDDSATITMAEASAIEGEAVTFTVELSKAASAEVTVNWATEDGSATAGEDYIGGSGQVTIAAGTTSATFDVATITDEVDEDNKSFRVTLTADGLPDPITLATIAPVLGRVIDDDTAGVTIDPEALTVTEAIGGRTADYTVVLTSEPTANVMVTPSSSDPSVATVPSTPLTFTPVNWKAAQTVTVTGMDDRVDNPTDRTATISHAVSGGDYNDLRADEVPDVAVTLTDDDTAGVTVSTNTLTVAEAEGTGTYTVELDSEPTGTVTITPTSTETSVATVASPPLTFTARNWNTAQTVTVRGVNDPYDNPGDRSTTITLGVMGYDGVTTGPEVTVTATDDEATPTATLTLAPASIAENAETSTVTATLNHGSTVPVTLTVEADPGSGAEARDFRLSQNAELTFAPRQTSSAGAVSVTAVDNNVDAPDKSVTVSASVTSGTATAPADRTLTITDDDAAPTVTLSVVNPAILEDGGTTRVRAAMNRASSEPTTVTVTPATGSYTVGSPATLTIPAGMTASTGAGVVITAVNDPIDNVGDRQVMVTGTAANTHGVVQTATPASLTLTDDENTPTATLVLTPPTIDEGGTTTASRVTATLSHGSSEEVTLTVSAIPDTGAQAGDFRLTGSTLTIPAERMDSTGTVTITAVDNDVVAPEKQVTVRAVVGGDSRVSPPSEATLTITEDDTATISVADASAAEGQPVIFTVSLSKAASVEVTVDWATSDGTATSADYTATSGMATIPAGSKTSPTFAVMTTDDSAAESSETFTVTLTEPTGGGFPAGVSLAPDPTATGTVIDNDTPGVTVDPTSFSVAENGGTGSYTVVLNTQPTGPVTITPTSTDSSVAMVTSSPLTFTTQNWGTAQTVTVMGVNDAYDNPNDRSTTITHAVRGYVGVTEGPVVTVTATDDEASPTATLVLTPPSITENAGASTVTATLSHGSTDPVTLTVSAAPGSGAENSDFRLSPNAELTFAPRQISSAGVVTVTAVNNNDDTPNKTVEVSAVVSDGEAIVPAPRTLTITDDDHAPTVTLRVADLSIAEDGGTTTVTATMNRASSAPTTVTVTPETGFYTVGATATLTVPAGDTASDGTGVTITAVNDPIDNVGDRRVAVTGTAMNTHGIAEALATPASLTLTDDESVPTATLVLTPGSISEDGGTSMVTATLSHGSSEAVTLTISAVSGAGTMDEDFTLTGTTLTIAAEEMGSTGTVTIAAEDNEVVAADKSVTVSAGVGGNSGVQPPAPVALAITEDDAATVSVADASAVEGQPVTFAVTLSAEVSTEVRADWRTVDNPGVAAYMPATGQAVFAPGTTSATIEVVTIDDNVADGVDTFEVELAAPTGGFPPGVSLGDGLAVGSINDNDAVGVAFSERALTVTEVAGATRESTYTVALTSEPTADVTVTLASGAPTVATVEPASLMFTSTTWNTAQMVTVTGVDNDVDNPNDSMTTIMHAAAGGDYEGITIPGVTVTLTDDEATPTATLSLMPDSIVENDETSTVTASLSHGSSEAVTLTVVVTPNAPATTGDYSLSANKDLTIAAGQTASTGTVTITSVDNDDMTASKTFAVTATVSGSSGVAPPTAQTLTIADDEGPPTVSLVLTPDTIAENGGVSMVTATLNRSQESPITVTVSASGTGFTLGETRALTIDAGQTVSSESATITAEDDEVDGPDKTVTVSGEVTAGTLEDPADQTLTITDDEGVPTVALVLEPEMVPESETATVTARLSGPSSEAVTLTVMAAPGAGTEADDFTLSGTELTIAAGTTDSTGRVEIVPADDAVDEDNRMVTVSATVSGGNGIEVPEDVILTIADDDGDPKVTLVLTPATILPDGGVSTVTARLSNPTVVPVTVTVSAAPADDASAGGFTLSENKDLTIEAGATESTGVVTITGVEDPDRESATLTVTVSATVMADRPVMEPDDVSLLIASGLSPERRQQGLEQTAGEVLGVMGWQTSSILGGRGFGADRSEPTVSVDNLPSVNPDDPEDAVTQLTDFLDSGTEFSFVLAPPSQSAARASLALEGESLFRIWAKGSSASVTYDPLENRTEEGSIRTVHLGVDATYDSGLVIGVALGSHNASIDFEDRMDGDDVRASGTVETAMSSLNPYIAFDGDGVRYWGSIGLGQGEYSQEEKPGATGSAGDRTTSADLGMVSVRGGIEYVLGDFDEVELVGRGDGMYVKTDVEGAAHPEVGYDGFSATSFGARGQIEIARTSNLDDVEVRPFGSLGAHWDGGDSGIGTSLAIGGGVTVRSSSVFFEGEIWKRQGSGSNFDLTGVSLTLGYDEARDRQGPLVELAHSAGATGFDPFGDDPQAAFGSTARKSALGVRVGYGIGLRENLFTPYAEADWAEAGLSSLGSGLEYKTPRGNFGIDYRLKPAATRPDRRDEHSVGAEFRIDLGK